MPQNDQANFSRYRFLTGASALALATALAAGAAHAQSDSAADGPSEEADDKIVVTGIRESLESSQDTKRRADVFVDAITAEDIGALPDRSVAEALQRVPGVAITRFEGVNDPDHFTVEGAGVVIRGLNFVRSELNGRDVFAADSGQGIGFNDISPELLGSVVVFKNQSADLIEGGIAGTVNLNVRKPFDQEGRLIAFTAEGNYSGLAEEIKPSFSGAVSDRWQTGIGEVGILLGGSYSKLASRADNTLIADWFDREPDDGQTRIVPSGAGVRTQLFDRERNSIAASAQWESNDSKWQATAEFFRARYINSWTERAIEPSIDDGPSIVPRAGTSFKFGNGGLFERGILSSPEGWRGPDSFTENQIFPLTGVRQLALSRGRLDESLTTDYGFNLKWAPLDNLRFNFDAQYIESDVEVSDLTIHNGFYSDVSIDLTGDGEVPAVSYLAPVDGAVFPYFSSEENYYLRSAMDHLQDNEGDEFAVKADAEYDFSGESWLQSVRFGGRYSKREQTVRNSTFNWGNISEQWNGGGIMPSNTDFIPSGLFKVSNLDNYMRGDVGNLGLGAGAPFWAGPDLANDFRAAQATINSVAQTVGRGGWTPLQLRSGVVPGTAFLPSEINETELETFAGYIRFDFGTDDLFGSGITVDGNMGVRYVKSNISVVGALTFPDGAQALGGETVEEYCTTDLPPGTPPEVILANLPTECRNGPDEARRYFTWADATVISPIPVEYDYDNWLPSLNVKFGLDDNKLIRFGYSRAIFRPDFGLLKSNFTITTGDTDESGAWLGPRVDTGNAALDPNLADQVDLSFEWYFADVGSLTITGFYKSLKDAVTPLATTVPFSNNGETFQVNLNSNSNFQETATIKGVEFAYQQVFDMLPEPFNNLGIQANYTYVDADGLPVEVPKSDEPTGVGGSPVIDVRGLQFPLLSKHNANLVGFYEDEHISLRLAYVWRSEYVLTTRDVIFPFTPILHEATGQLDASIFYNVTDSIKVGVQAVNLLDEVTETRAVINDDLLDVPRAFSVNDRRYSFIVRGRF